MYISKKLILRFFENCFLLIENLFGLQKMIFYTLKTVTFKEF